MTRAIFRSSRGDFNRKHAAFKDMVQGHMAMDIEVALKTTAGMPVKTGAMKTDTRHFKTNNDRWRVEIDKEYAAFQERGGRADGTHRVKNYSTGGTSKGFFQRAIDSVERHKDNYVKVAARALGL